jgi:hypothetical protein
MSALALLAVAGCAGGQAKALAQGSSGPEESGRSAAVAAPVESLPAPCSVVDGSDASLFVALADWRLSGGEQAGRSVCRLEAPGYVVTTVTMRLLRTGAPPQGLCAPDGTNPAPEPPSGALCAYLGPESESATTVVAAGGLAVGVRVTGPEAAGTSRRLAEHALGHL